MKRHLQRAGALLAALCAAAALPGCASAPASGRAPVIEAVMRGSDGSGQDADSPAHYYALGRYHQQHGELDAAALAFGQAIALAPQQLDARNALAVLTAQQGQLEPARALLMRLVADFPDQAQPLSNLGYVEYLRGDYAHAAAVLRQALALDAQQPHVRANLALAERALGDHGAAMPTPTQTQTQTQPATVATSAPATAPASTPGMQPDTKRQTQSKLHHAAPVTQPMPSRLEVVQLAANEFRLQPRAAQSVVAKASSTASAPALATASTASPAVAQAIITTAPLATAATATTPPLIVTASLSDAPAVPAPAASLPEAGALQIINGNGVRGAGWRIKRALSRYGIASGRVLDQRRHYQRRTIIEYLPGRQAQADALLAALHGHATLIAVRSLPDGSAIRLVLGRDLLPHLARIETAAHAPPSANLNQAAG